MQVAEKQEGITISRGWMVLPERFELCKSAHDALIYKDFSDRRPVLVYYLGERPWF
jgi:hypothetical protein